MVCFSVATLAFLQVAQIREIISAWKCRYQLGIRNSIYWEETTQSNVLMIDLELRRDVAMERLIHIANAKGFDKVPDNLFLWSLQVTPMI